MQNKLQASSYCQQLKQPNFIIHWLSFTLPCCSWVTVIGFDSEEVAAGLVSVTSFMVDTPLALSTFSFKKLNILVDFTPTYSVEESL